MHKKPTGFVKNRGRPPNSKPTFVVDSEPRSYECCNLQVHEALVCHEKLFAVKLRWGDRSRIRDDTAALMLLLVRAVYNWSKPRSDAPIVPLGSFSCQSEALCFNWSRKLSSSRVELLLPRPEVYVAKFAARDWICLTCARGLTWKLAGHNQTTTYQEVAFLPAKKRGGRGMSKNKQWFWQGNVYCPSHETEFNVCKN